MNLVILAWTYLCFHLANVLYNTNEPVMTYATLDIRECFKGAAEQCTADASE
jgi:hypothetical protein